MPPVLTADGSAQTDAHPRVILDVREELDRWRYRCPNGHRGKAWCPTNSHIYCYSCKRQMDNGEDVSPEHYHLVDVKTGAEIPFSAFEFVGV